MVPPEAFVDFTVNHGDARRKSIDKKGGRLRTRRATAAKYSYTSSILGSFTA